jgi:hypothetical protein
MVDIFSMVDLTSISAILAAVGVFVGVVFAVLQLRDLVKTRQTDLIMRLYSDFGSDELQRAGLTAVHIEYEDYKDFVEKYGPPNSDNPVPLAIIKSALFFERVGILLHRKLIEVDTVSSVFGYSIRVLWEKLKPLMEESRKALNDPTIWKWFEYLYNEMQKREQQLTTIQ